MRKVDPVVMYAKYKHIVERFKYWSEVKRRRTDDVILILMYKECFVSQHTIFKVLRDWKPDPDLERQLKDRLSLCAINKPEQDTGRLPGLFDHVD